MTLPDFIDPECWAGFVEMRAAFRPKKPFTNRAKKLIINKLIAFKERGYDPNAILDEATEKSWLTVYEPKVGNYGTYQQGTTGGRESPSERDARLLREFLDSSNSDNVDRLEITGTSPRRH